MDEERIEEHQRPSGPDICAVRSEMDEVGHRKRRDTVDTSLKGEEYFCHQEPNAGWDKVILE